MKGVIFFLSKSLYGVGPIQWRISKVHYSPFDFISLVLTPTGSGVSCVPPSMHLCSISHSKTRAMALTLQKRGSLLHLGPTIAVSTGWAIHSQMGWLTCILQ